MSNLIEEAKARTLVSMALLIMALTATKDAVTVLLIGPDEVLRKIHDELAEPDECPE